MESPQGLRYVVERLLSRRKAWTVPGLPLSPHWRKFSRCLRRFPAWRPGSPGTNRDEAARLLAEYSVIRVPTLVWMCHVGNEEAHRFAQEQLTALHMETVLAQFAVEDRRTRQILENTYLQLTCQFPGDPQLAGTALAVAEFAMRFWFLYWPRRWLSSLRVCRDAAKG